MSNNRIFTLAHSVFLFIMAMAFLSGCATESHRTIATETVQSHGTSYTGKKSMLVVGNFQNRSNYLNGIFSSGTDHLGNQAKTILKTHLQQTGRFTVMDRANMAQLSTEAGFAGIEQKIKGARIVVTGDVTEFGRKETGDHQLFGILGSGKQQVAYAKVVLNIVDVTSSEIIHSTQGAGEYILNSREVIGFGASAGYDATLNGKVLNFAITEAVNNLVRDFESKAWSI